MMNLLPLSVSLVLLGLATRSPVLGVWGGAFMLVFFLRYWTSLMPYPRRLGVVTLSVLVWWLAVRGATWPELHKVLGSAAYYGTFVGALGLMQVVVKRLRQISELHRFLLAGPTRLLYPSYLLSAFAISSVLSFGMLNLVCSSLQHHLDKHPYSAVQRLGGQRGVMVTALRGFALVPLIAPTSVTVAILSRELPGLTWSALLPHGLLCALILLILGWPAEGARLSMLSQPDDNAADQGLNLTPLLMASLIGIGLITALASFTWLSATQAAMILIPPSIMLFLARKQPLTEVAREVTGALAEMRNEIFIFATAGMLGGLAATLVPVEQLAPLFKSSPVGPFILGCVAMLGIILLALAGVAPIVTLNLCAGLLVPLAEQGVAIMQPAVALLAGFSLAMLLSPYGPSVLMLSRYAQISPWNITLQWNGYFVLLAIAPLLAIAWLA